MHPHMLDMHCPYTHPHIHSHNTCMHLPIIHVGIYSHIYTHTCCLHKHTCLDGQKGPPRSSLRLYSCCTSCSFSPNFPFFLQTCKWHLNKYSCPIHTTTWTEGSGSPLQMRELPGRPGQGTASVWGGLYPPVLQPGWQHRVLDGEWGLPLKEVTTYRDCSSSPRGSC